MYILLSAIEQQQKRMIKSNQISEKQGYAALWYFLEYGSLRSVVQANGNCPNKTQSTDFRAYAFVAFEHHCGLLARNHKLGPFFVLVFLASLYRDLHLVSALYTY
jgi:hypothetical protein